MSELQVTDELSSWIESSDCKKNVLNVSSYSVTECSEMKTFLFIAKKFRYMLLTTVLIY